jgi:hypothetical protein
MNDMATRKKRKKRADRTVVLFHEKTNGEQTAVTHAEQKRFEMQNAGSVSKQQQQPITIDGTALPSKEDGWHEEMPPKPEQLSMIGSKTVVMSDGTVRRFRKWRIKKEVLTQKRKLAKRMLKRCKRELQQTEAKEAKQRVRLFLFALGKI